MISYDLQCNPCNKFSGPVSSQLTVKVSDPSTSLGGGGGLGEQSGGSTMKGLLGTRERGLMWQSVVTRFR